MILSAFVSCAFLQFPMRDPAPGLLRSKEQARALHCERLTPEAMRREQPGRIARPNGRGDFVEHSVVLCAQSVFDVGDREPRDEAILADLDARVGEFALTAASLRPDLRERTWLVEVSYPNPEVSGKISFAAKNALMGRGLQVSDRVPTLGAGDVDVITRLGVDDAYRAACFRFAASGSLRPEDVLMAVVTRDRRSTVLQAGLCSGGQWTWLR